jgi:hypothetical protein
MDSWSIFLAGAFVGAVITLFIVFNARRERSLPGGRTRYYYYDHIGRRIYRDDDDDYF